MASFGELASSATPMPDELQAFGRRWGIEYLAPPLKARDADVPGGLD